MHILKNFTLKAFKPVRPYIVTMSYNKVPIITPFEGGTLAQARQAVINAFSTGDEEFTWTMLCVFYISTSKIEIIEECEKYRKFIEEQIQRINSKLEHSPQESFSRIMTRNTFQEKTNLEFYKKIMLLCAEHHLTEFDAIKPREENKGQRLTSGPSR
jgi:hypothetical protein